MQFPDSLESLSEKYQSPKISRSAGMCREATCSSVLLSDQHEQMALAWSRCWSGEYEVKVRRRASPPGALGAGFLEMQDLCSVVLELGSRDTCQYPQEDSGWRGWQLCEGPGTLSVKPWRKEKPVL